LQPTGALSRWNIGENHWTQCLSGPWLGFRREGEEARCEIANDVQGTDSITASKAGTHSERAMFFAYLLASKPHGTLYIGSTSDLMRRVWEHKAKAVPGFTAKYGVDRMVWFERYDTLEAAIQRERRIKSWKRAWKIELIEKDNPHWIDLYSSLST